MKYAIITVAGMSERFNKGYDNPVLKCIYFENDEKETLLYSILEKCEGIDKVIIVGGYQYKHLLLYIDKYRRDFSFDIEVIYNKEYFKYGSGYSLFCGLNICYERKDWEEIIFIEGDLYFDFKTFDKIKKKSQNIITLNNDPIHSNKAVALYMNRDNEIKYIYNAAHGLFEIKEEFSAIYNSGQIWKLINREIFDKTYNSLDEEDWKGINLLFLQRYFNDLEINERQFLKFKKWINCNTRDDYRRIV